MDFVTASRELESQIIADRRFLHQHAELGFDLPETRNYVLTRLRELGYDPKEMGQGITAQLGEGSPCILLRADMDALPMAEENELPFRSENPGIAHTCGHDMHAAMLLGAAAILAGGKEKLPGTVKFMFQANEEGGQGAKAMVDAGVLEDPKVDAAIGMHTAAARDSGSFYYAVGSTMASSDGFSIEVTGRGGHGAGPQFAIDPINIACHIHLGLQELIAREAPPAEVTVLTIGSLHSGTAGNIIPQTATMQGTLRTHCEQTREKLKRRMEELCAHTAQAFGGEAKLTFQFGIPVLYNDADMADKLAETLKAHFGEDCVHKIDMKLAGSEDFAELSLRVPSVYLSIGTGHEKDGFLYGQHHPKVIFDEGCMKNGAAAYALCAWEWLKSAESEGKVKDMTSGQFAGVFR